MSGISGAVDSSEVLRFGRLCATTSRISCSFDQVSIRSVFVGVFQLSHLNVRSFLSKSWNANNVTKLAGINRKEMWQCLWLNMGTINTWLTISPSSHTTELPCLPHHRTWIDPLMWKLVWSGLLSAFLKTLFHIFHVLGSLFASAQREGKVVRILQSLLHRECKKKQRCLRPGCQGSGSSFLQISNRSTNKMMNKDYTTLRT